MFKKILIANRGEIALRIIRACKEMGIKTVAVYSDIDAQSLHVRFADESVCVGPAEDAASYRNIPNILSAAEITDAEAIHPGYGFLSENSHFAEACELAGITFIGPSPESIALMGDKVKAREVMIRHGVPVLPGSPGSVTTDKEAIETAQALGYPVIIKAAAGGGGRGMRVVHQEEALLPSFQAASAEAKAAFGNGEVYVEKYFTEHRHVEVQILGDKGGRIIHLGERDCSIQRRHQKLVEETPSPAVDDGLREEMGSVAVKAAHCVGYRNAGTVEFLLDEKGRFYFLEMNTRIQVEHPITEMVTGVDLVKEQIRIACGLPLSFPQELVRLKGHSFECRINAECPETFTPCPGTVNAYHPPGGPGVRVDSALYPNCPVPPQYDSLIAKLIVHGETREEARRRMLRALDEFIIEGVKTTIPLHTRIFSDSSFQAARISTSFLERFFGEKASTS